jgi:hypothetical protein
VFAYRTRDVYNLAVAIASLGLFVALYWLRFPP